MHIRYNLFKLNKALTFQVVRQGLALTVFLRELGQFKASNGWRVKTNNYPGIDMKSKIIFIRGFNSDLDNYPSSAFGFDNEHRDVLVGEIYKALQELLSAAIGEDNQIEYPSYEESEFIPVSCKPVDVRTVRHISL